MVVAMEQPNPLQSSTLLSLPSELLDHILTFLPPYDLVSTSSTCRRLHQHSSKDTLWQSFVNSNLPNPTTSASPAQSFRDLFIRHHPNWFVPRYKIWYSDLIHHGKLIVARYDPRRGCIEGYAVVATRGSHENGILHWPDQVHYDTFHPKVTLDLNQPVIQLDFENTCTPNTALSRETRMKIHSGNSRRIGTAFVPTRNLARELGSTSASLWPPRKIPSPGGQRVRNQSHSAFRSTGHVPKSKAQFSDATFRIRQWIEHSHVWPITRFMEPSIPYGEVVLTFATLPEECYTPTKEKPWQGIWCGDYGGHGCEFLLITQPDEPDSLPAKAQKPFERWPDNGANRNDFGLIGMISPEIDDDPDFDEDLDGEAAFYGGVAGNPSASAQVNESRPYLGPSPNDVAPYKGRLEAIKLTGDPNVPRGEYTFIAPDIGENGFIGYASESLFKARADETSPASTSRQAVRKVRGVGHIAGTDFTDDTYIATQLIMISENRLAQYWMRFQHVSFFERVDLNKLLNT